MATDAERNKAAASERRKRQKDLPRIQRDTAKELQRLLRRAERELRAQMAGGSDFTHWLNPQLRQSVRKTLETLGTDMGKAVVTGAEAAWDAGMALVDAPIDAALKLDDPQARVAAHLASVDLRQLGAMREFLTTKMSDVSLQAINRVNTALGLAATGVHSTGEAVGDVAKILGSTRKRGVTIVRTELGRAYSVAGQERMTQAQQRLPGLKKQWRRSGKIHSRFEHDAADGQIQEVGQPFQVGGVELMYPRDPAAPARHTINCGCQSLPYMESWAESDALLHPKRRPFTPEEIAFRPIRAELDEQVVDPWTIAEMSRADVTAHQVGGQGGSNPGGLFEGADGKLRYVKFYNDTAQAYGEAVANRAYRELGLDAPASTLVRDGDNIVGIANEIIDHAGIIGDKLGPGGQNWQSHLKSALPSKGRSKEVLKGYAADVWLMNWDVLGRDMDNIVKTRTRWNSVARIDQGGALLMRGLQGRKPRKSFDAITEWDGFANPQRNPSYAAVLRAAGYDSADELGRQAIRQIEAIEALGKRTNDFRDLARSVQGISTADQDTIRMVLAQRAALLKSEIVPRVRAAMAAAKTPLAHQARTRSNMGKWYDVMLQRANRKIAAGAPRRNMTDPELVTTYAYTTEEAVWSHYARLNAALRDAAKPGGPKVPRRYEDYRLTLNDALDKLPDQPGTSWRGANLSREERAEYVPGNIVSWPAFSSTSRRKEKAFYRNSLFRVEGHHGKDIKPYSAVPSEDEMLFKSGSRFRVLKRYKEPDGRYGYLLEEVGDDQ